MIRKMGWRVFVSSRQTVLSLRNGIFFAFRSVSPHVIDLVAHQIPLFGACFRYAQYC